LVPFFDPYLLKITFRQQGRITDFTDLTDGATAPLSDMGGIVTIADKSPRIGRIQLRVRRALIAADGKPVTITDLLQYCYPFTDRFKMWHRTNIHRAVHKFAVEVGRRRCRGAPILWALKPRTHTSVI
jgi:hypothetical protein